MRKKGQKEYNCKEIYIYFFWTQCMECRDSIKKENMWKHEECYCNVVTENYYLCKNCASSQDIAHSKFAKI